MRRLPPGRRFGNRPAIAGEQAERRTEPGQDGIAGRRLQ